MDMSVQDAEKTMGLEQFREDFMEISRGNHTDDHDNFFLHGNLRDVELPNTSGRVEIIEFNPIRGKNYDRLKLEKKRRRDARKRLVNFIKDLIWGTGDV